MKILHKSAITLFLLFFITACAPISTTDQNTLDTDHNDQETTPTGIIHDDGIFSIAIIPDTQQEVVVDQAIRNKHFLNRIEWLVDNSPTDIFDIQCVIHTGDVVNWGNEAPVQFEIASEAMSPLEKNNIPVLYAIGNHDTAAVTVGGAAADPKNTRSRQRDTTKFNEYFPLERYDYLTPFEEEKNR